MTIAFVQVAGAESSAAGATLSVPIAPAPGNTLVVVTNLKDGGFFNVSISDDAPGGSSTYIIRKHENLGTIDVEVWSTDVGGLKSGVTTVTVTFGNTGERAVICGEYSGVGAIGVNVGNNSGTSTTATANCITADNNNWVVGGIGAASLVTYSGIVGTQRGALQGVTETLALIDNTSATPSIGLPIQATLGSSVLWGVASFELRSVGFPVSVSGGQQVVMGKMQTRPSSVFIS